MNVGLTPPVDHFDIEAALSCVSEAAPKKQNPDGDNSAGAPSDDSLALEFTAQYGDDLRYTAELGRWSIWNGSVWRKDQTLKVYDLARNVCRERAARGEKRSAPRIASAQTVAAVERLARADRRRAATVDQWDRDPWLLNTPHGIVDLRTGTSRPARREDYMTKMTTVAPKGICPAWDAFLDQVTNRDSALKHFLQRLCGYMLTGLTREHALFFIYGTGANGKSVFLNAISGMMGTYARIAPIEAFIESRNQNHPTELAGLQGARLVTAVETEDGRRWAEAKLKALTGGDKIAARLMRQDFFEFTPQFKLVIAGNHKPGLRGVDEAMRRRLHLVPFTVTIPPSQRDRQLSEKLRAEWPAILAWAIEGCLAWQDEGLNPPDSVGNATEEYFIAEDALGRWLEDYTERKAGVWESATELFRNWKRWAELNNENPGSQKRFSENLVVRGYKQRRKDTGRGFDGIALKKLIMTDHDGSADYLRHTRTGNGDNGKTRHNPSSESIC